MDIYNELTYINKSSIALGYFDGLHLGHRVVLKNAINIAKEYNTQTTVIIFKEHPLNFLTTDKVEQILTLEEKINILREIGIDNIILLDFKDYSGIKAEDYLKNILVKYFSPVAITTGFNHFFGYKKEGNSDFLRKNKDKYNYKYFEVPPFVVNENIVSCSVIRNKISLGNFQEANNLLGYNYFVNGTVIEGQKIASKLGFASANIHYPDSKVQIPHGVYYVTVSVDDKEYNGILNHGFAPTINNEQILKTEVHIIDFNKDIYGKNIKVSFITKIRNQMKFENIDKLKSQLNRDKAFAEIYKHFLDGTFHLDTNRFSPNKFLLWHVNIYFIKLLK